MADYTIKQGDSAPALTDTLTYSDGTAVDLTGATVKLLARSELEDAPRNLTGVVTITPPATGGTIQYSPTTDDTAQAGMLIGAWQVTFPGGTVMTFPTDGYLWINIEENLAATGMSRGLVSIPDLKEHLDLDHSNRTLDSKLQRYIEAATPVIEHIVGPVIPRVFEEWHDGGQYFIRLRRRPSTAPGTSPLLDLVGCSEYRGPIKYDLRIIQDPAHGDIYSCMLDPRLGTVTRRTTGGGVIGFPAMAQSVHVVYRAGQQTVPLNVREATLELIRFNYQPTQQVGRGRFTVADEEDTGVPLGFYVPRRVRELLAPNRRAPAIA